MDKGKTLADIQNVPKTKAETERDVLMFLREITGANIEEQKGKNKQNNNSGNKNNNKSPAQSVKPHHKAKGKAKTETEIYKGNALPGKAKEETETFKENKKNNILQENRQNKKPQEDKQSKKPQEYTQQEKPQNIPQENIKESVSSQSHPGFKPLTSSRSRGFSRPRGQKVVPKVPVYSLVHNKTGEVFELTDGFTVGRIDGNNAVFSDDIYISGTHLIFRIEDNVLYVKDNNSTNGTTINRANIARGEERQVNENDSVRIGENTVLTVRVDYI